MTAVQTQIVPEQWWSETESPKAWMSVRDADLLEAVLHRLAAWRGREPLRVLEWGAGRSTAGYTAFLATLGRPSRWLSPEHDRWFVDDQVVRSLAGLSNVAVARDVPGDLVVVDGLKRSRCLLEARDLLAPRGYAMRHDAWHKHYQCAFPAFTSGRRIGDEWWIDTGMYTDCTDFTAVVPWHAPERNAALPQ